MNTIKEFMTHVAQVPHTNTEEWKFISEPDIAEGSYKISSLGRAKNAKSGRILTQIQDIRGYWFVRMRDKNGITRHFYLHRLVACYFLPAGGEDQKEVDHIDGNKFHNDKDNLRWCTHAENMRNIVTRLRRSKNIDAKLDDFIGLPVTKNDTEVAKKRRQPVRIKCEETGVIYESLIEAAKAYNTDYRCIIASYRSGIAIGEHQHHFKPVDPYQGNA